MSKVSNKFLAQAPANTLKGNNTGSTANVADLTVSQVQTLLSIPTSSSALPINAGGTGATTASGAFNALNPMTTIGDIIYESGTSTASRLGIGSTGQVLTVVSGIPAWATPAASSPLTTKGDLYGYNTANARIPVGGDNKHPTADSTSSLGITYQYPTAKNYISNPGFESNTTTNWSLGTAGTLTNGIPTGSPTFGSGASGNLSISTVSSGQLAGNYSLSYASSAATTAGNMLASASFNIDAEDQAKVLTFKFYYSVPSGASNCNFSGTSSNSFAVAVWDVTNSVWLSSTANFGMTQARGTGYCTGTVQTGITTAAVRFVLYNANATAGAATLYLDDFYLGPQTAPLGAVMTDWIAYTPTFSGMGTVTGASFFSRRVGDSLEVTGYFGVGTPAASTAEFTLGFNGSNGNVTTADTTKINDNGNYGTWNGNDIGQGANLPIIGFHSAGYLAFGITNGSIGNGLSAQNGNVIFGAGEVITVNARIPIQGWSSNVQMSSDTDTRVVAFYGYLSNNYSVSANNPIVYNTTLKDTHAAYSTSTGLYTVPVTGFYNVAVTMDVNNTAAIYIGHNSSADKYIAYQASANTVSVGSGIIFANAGDTISATCNTTCTVNGGSSPYVNALSINRLSGPSVIAATESVNARYNQPTNVSVTASSAFAYSTKNFDTHSAYNTSTGIYTVPVSGKYQVIARLFIGANQYLNVFVNGTAMSQGDSSGSTTAATIFDIVQVNAGDQITIVPLVSGTTVGGAYLSNFSISRIGN
jgi:hypothetical protein